MTKPTAIMIARALDEIARAAAYIHTRSDGSGLGASDQGSLGAIITLRSLETVLAMHKDELNTYPRPWNEDIPDLPPNLRGNHR